MNEDLEVDTGQDVTTPPEPNFRNDARAERKSVRESLERSFEDARTEEPRDTGRENRRDVRGRPRVKEEVSEPETTTTPELTEPVQVEAPTAWAKEAKEHWGTIPPEAQAAIIKREQDVEKGVKELQSKYSELEKAVAPHRESIRRFGKTEAQAVEQLFAWFDALSKNPDQAFPALIQSYGYDPRRIAQAFGLNQAAPQATPEPVKEAQPEEAVSPAVQQYITKLEEKLNGFQNQVGQQLNGIMGNFAEQSMAKTHEVLNNWAKDKPHFDKVRVMMGHLLTPDPNTGVSAVPLKDGRVDLDTAYNMAIYALPDIRQQILADEQNKAVAAQKAKQAAEAKAQQDQANRARRTGGSLGTSSPGAEASRKGTVPKGKTVRDSLRDAMTELSS